MFSAFTAPGWAWRTIFAKPALTASQEASVLAYLRELHAARGELSDGEERADTEAVCLAIRDGYATIGSHAGGTNRLTAKGQRRLSATGWR